MDAPLVRGAAAQALWRHPPCWGDSTSAFLRSMSFPQLSIIIPALNEAPILIPFLSRLQALRAHGHEVILVDGGSHDETADIAKELVDRVVKAPRGRARQMNCGAGVANGEVLVFLHADTWLPAHADRTLARALQGEWLGWGRFDVELTPQRWLLPLVAFAMNVRSRLTGIATGDQAIFLHRSLFERVGGFPDIPLMEDVAMSARLKRVSAPLCLRDKVKTSSRRWVKRGVLRTVVTMWWLRLRYALGTDPQRLHRIYSRL